jgi:hypothetical protein
MTEPVLVNEREFGNGGGTGSAGNGERFVEVEFPDGATNQV